MQAGLQENPARNIGTSLLYSVFSGRKIFSCGVQVKIKGRLKRKPRFVTGNIIVRNSENRENGS